MDRQGDRISPGIIDPLACASCEFCSRKQAHISGSLAISLFVANLIIIPRLYDLKELSPCVLCDNSASCSTAAVIFTAVSVLMRGWMSLCITDFCFFILNSQVTQLYFYNRHFKACHWIAGLYVDIISYPSENK